MWDFWRFTPPWPNTFQRNIFEKSDVHSVECQWLVDRYLRYNWRLGSLIRHFMQMFPLICLASVFHLHVNFYCEDVWKTCTQTQTCNMKSLKFVCWHRNLLMFARMPVNFSLPLFLVWELVPRGSLCQSSVMTHSFCCIWRPVAPRNPASPLWHTNTQTHDLWQCVPHPDVVVAARLSLGVQTGCHRVGGCSW